MRNFYGLKRDETPTLRRVFDFGQVKFHSPSQKKAWFCIEIRLKSAEEGPVFLSKGLLTKHLHPADLFLISEETDLGKDPLFQEIYRLSSLYNLNNLHAGTEEQEAALRQYQETGWEFDFSEACAYLKKLGLYEVTLQNGATHRYGSDWLYREIPEKDLMAIKNLFSRTEER